jgi:phage-related protein
LLRMLQRGESLGMPHTWRIICRVDSDAIVIVEVFDKKTRATPKVIIETCKGRLRRYDAV